MFGKGKANLVDSIGLNSRINEFRNKLALEVLSSSSISICAVLWRWWADLEEELLRPNVQGFLARSLEILRET